MEHTSATRSGDRSKRLWDIQNHHLLGESLEQDHATVSFSIVLHLASRSRSAHPEVVDSCQCTVLVELVEVCDRNILKSQITLEMSGIDLISSNSPATVGCLPRTHCAGEASNSRACIQLANDIGDSLLDTVGSIEGQIIEKHLDSFPQGLMSPFHTTDSLV